MKDEKQLTNMNRNPKIIANFISCLSILEDDTASLYRSLSEKVGHPLVKSLLFSISEDSRKHGTLLRGVAESISKIPGKPTNCEKNAGDTWHLVAYLKEAIKNKETFSEKDMAELSEKLIYLESIIGEEYYMFVQVKTLEMMMKEINQIYHIDLGSLRRIFTSIISDEERHREIIAEIRSIIGPRQEEEPENRSPLVRYTTPDKWISPFSQANLP